MANQPEVERRGEGEGVGCVSRTMIIGVYLRLSAVKYQPPINADKRR